MMGHCQLGLNSGLVDVFPDARAISEDYDNDVRQVPPDTGRRDGAVG
jgi:hypothetical protein